METLNDFHMTSKTLYDGLKKAHFTAPPPLQKKPLTNRKPSLKASLLLRCSRLLTSNTTNNGSKMYLILVN